MRLRRLHTGSASSCVANPRGPATISHCEQLRARRSGDSRAVCGRLLRAFLPALLAGLVVLPGVAGPVSAGPSDRSPEPAFGVPTSELADLSLEQLMEIKAKRVYGASRYDQPVSRAPASVSIVTAEEISLLGHRTLADSLRSVRGLYVVDDRNYSYLGFRGFARPGDYNTRVLLLSDGHRMNENVYDSAYFGRESILDIDLVDRIEVIRGPSSSIYGSSAFLGVINLVPRRGSQIDGLEASTEGGSFDTYKARITYGTEFRNGVDLVLSGSLFGSAGDRSLYFPEFDTPGTSHGIAHNSDEEYVRTAYAALRYRDFTFTGAFSEREKNIPTASYGTAFDSGLEETIDLRAYADVKYEHEFASESRLMARVGYDLYPYYGTYPSVREDPREVVLNKDRVLGEWITTEAQWRQPIAERHTFIGGVEYRENLRQNQRNFDEAPRVVFLDKRQTSRVVGVYGQAEIGLLTNLLANVGIRYDYYSTFGSTLNPRTGLIYTPWGPTTFKLLYGQAYRAPNVYEMFYELEGGYKSNPDLDPETIRTYELVAEQKLPAGVQLTLSGYHYTVDDLISQSLDPSDGLISFRNIDKVEATGLELEVERRWMSGLVVRASYARQRSEDSRTGRELSNSPRHLGKFQLIVPVWGERLYTGLELQYHGKVWTLQRRRADDFLVANLTLFSHELVKGLGLSAGIYNLFDTEYGYPGASEHLQDEIPQDGRTFRLKLTARF